VCRSLTPAHDMWQSSSPAVERFMRREIGPEGRVRDFLADLDKVRTSLLRLPDTLDRLTEAAERMQPDRSEVEAARRSPLTLGLLVTAAALLGALLTLAFTGQIAL